MSLLFTAAPGSKAGHKQRSWSSFKSYSMSQPHELQWQQHLATAQIHPISHRVKVQPQLRKCGLGTNTLHSPSWQNLRLIYNIVKVTGKKLKRKCEKAYYILHKCTNVCTKPLDVTPSPPVPAVSPKLYNNESLFNPREERSLISNEQ